MTELRVQVQQFPFGAPVWGKIRAMDGTAGSTALLRDCPGAGTNLADVLRRIPGNESDPVSSIAAVEQGSLGMALCRSGNRKRRRDYPELPILPARAFHRGGPRGIRRDAFGYAAEY
jgi:hypothetical protein